VGIFSIDRDYTPTGVRWGDGARFGYPAGVRVRVCVVCGGETSYSAHDANECAAEYARLQLIEIRELREDVKELVRLMGREA
jgi:hypothetical protein